jgi:AraC-like DNA-binding protein
MNKSVLILLFCGFSFVGFSQQKPMYSQQLYDTIVENTRLNPKKAIVNAKKLLAYSKENKRLDSIGIAYLYLAKAGRVEGIYKEALGFADEGILFAKKNNLSNSLLAELHLSKANNLADFGRIDKALPILFTGVDYAKKSGDLKTRVILNHGLGYIYSASGNRDKAISIIKQNIALIEDNQLLDRKSFEVYYKGMIMLSQIYLVEKQNDSAIVYLNKGLKHVLTTDDAFTTSGFYRNLGRVYLDEKKYNLSFKNLVKSRELAKKLGNKIEDYNNTFYLAKYYFETSNFKQSIIELNTIIAYYKSKNEEERISGDVYKLLGKNYKTLGDYELANSYYEKYIINFKNSSDNIQNVSSFLQKKELSALEFEKQQQEKRTSYVVGASVIIIGLLLLFLFRLSKKRKIEALNFEVLLAKIKAQESSKEKALIDVKDTQLEEKSTTDINQETFDEILKGLKTIEEQHYYLKQDCNAYTIAKKIKTNTTYLSKVVNAYHQKNFNTYINDLRIGYVIIKLKDDTRFRAYSVQSISEEIGYKSPDSFTKYFKKRTGLLPSVYIKKLNNLE